MSEVLKYTINPSKHFHIKDPLVNINHHRPSFWRKVIGLNAGFGYGAVFIAGSLKIYVRILEGGYINFDSISDEVVMHNVEIDVNNIFFSRKWFFSECEMDCIHWLKPYTVSEGIYTVK